MPRRIAAVFAVSSLLLAACGHTASGGDTQALVTAAARSAPVADAGVASGLQTAFEQMVRTAGPSVVQIQSSSGLGSGIVVDARGDIVTNAHVVGTERRFQVTLPNGQARQATLVGAYPTDDLAVIHAVGSGFAPATFANSSQLHVGDIVLAVGNPLGLRSSVTQGIISALGRTVTEPGGTSIPGAIQTSAAINPGNSGGALVDLQGHVVGIPTLTVSDPQIGGAANGIGFAIASNTVTDIAGQLIRYGKVRTSHRAFLGVELAVAPTGTAGAVVNSVQRGSPAARAGIAAGDQILSINGQSTADANAVSSVLAGLAPGQQVTVTVRHQGGGTANVKVTLGQFPG
jgi:putative serine protease PepD